MSTTSATAIISDESALRAAVIAAPDDDAPRLVFADEIEERGRVEEAVFIRDQIAGRPTDFGPGGQKAIDDYHKRIRIARSVMGGRLVDLLFREWQDVTRVSNPAPDRPFFQVILTSNRGEWCVNSIAPTNGLQELQLPRISVLIRRGFVEELCIPVDSWRYGANEFLTLNPLRRIQDFRPGSPGVYDVDLRDEHERIAQAKSRKHPPPEPVPILHVGGHLHGLRSPVQPNADSWKMPTVIRYPFAEMHRAFIAAHGPGRRGSTPAEYRLQSVSVRSPAGLYTEEIYVLGSLTEAEVVGMMDDISNHEARRYIAASPRIR
jgi:uncharacterized protein (TIGR02996 family)